MEQPSGTFLALVDFEREHVRPRAGATLIMGSRIYGIREDRRARYANAVGWDALPGEGVDRVIDFENATEGATFDHIECISVLEHARRPWLVAANIERMLGNGGTLLLTVPFIWREHSYPHDFWRFTIDGVRSLFSRIAWAAVVYSHVRFTTVGEKINGTKIDGFPYFARTEVFAFGRMA